ncbi:MAG: hypothetical protein KJ645_02180 [Planctomycetes bacterium]|nr:hypothetical protein [Planctomycetota bacterium]
MKRYLTFLVLFLVLPSAAITQETKETKQENESKTENDLDLAPYIQKIKQGKVDSKRIAILYAILQNTHEVCIHQQNGAKDNQVYLHQDGHREAVYDKEGKLVEDGINDGSFNFFHPYKEPLRHFTCDISPWIMSGQSPKDPTTIKSRIHAYMDDLEGGIRGAINQKIRAEFDWKDDAQIQALAVFMRAIDEGKAASLFDLFKPGGKPTDKQLIDVLKKLNKGLEIVYSVPNEPDSGDGK